MFKYLYYFLICILFLSVSKSEAQNTSISQPCWYFFSFEQSIRGWKARGTDLGEPPIEWSIDLTDEMAKSGDTSLKFILANMNDAGKIWIERPFFLKPDCFYHVNVRYAFASADWGNVNLFTIITGVMQEPPETQEDLIYQGNTGNGSETDVGYVWLNKNYNFVVHSGLDGVLYIVIGVWGTWETTRIYYVDNIRITFREI